MTKRDLVKWLERKQNEATDAAADEYYAATGKAHNDVLHELGLEKAAKDMQEHIEKAYDIWMDFQKKCAVIDGVSFRDTYSSPSNRLYEYVGEKGTTFRILANSVIKLNTQVFQDAKTAYEDLIINIKRTYQNVIAVVQSFKTTKEAAAYLKDLGFDLNELDNPPAPVTALAVQINTSFLFINKNAA
jgi:hypothetical protein